MSVASYPFKFELSAYCFVFRVEGLWFRCCVALYPSRFELSAYCFVFSVQGLWFRLCVLCTLSDKSCHMLGLKGRRIHVRGEGEEDTYHVKL